MASDKEIKASVNQGTSFPSHGTLTSAETKEHKVVRLAFSKPSS